MSRCLGGKKFSGGLTTRASGHAAEAQIARAQDPRTRACTAGSDGGADHGPVSKLQNEVREQRQLIVEMLQSEQQRYDMLLKLLRAGGGAAPPDVMPHPSPRRRRQLDQSGGGRRP